MKEHLPIEVSEFLGYNYHIVTFRCAQNTDTQSIKEIVEQIIDEKLVPRYEKSSNKINKKTLLDYIITPFEAAKKYNENKEDILFDMYISSKGIVTAYSNGTPLLKRRDIKNYMENRQMPPVVEKGMDEIDLSFIFLIADMIHIDIKNGVAYLGLRKGNVLEWHE